MKLPILPVATEAASRNRIMRGQIQSSSRGKNYLTHSSPRGLKRSHDRREANLTFAVAGFPPVSQRFCLEIGSSFRAARLVLFWEPG